MYRKNTKVFLKKNLVFFNFLKVFFIVIQTNVVRKDLGNINVDDLVDVLEILRYALDDR